MGSFIKKKFASSNNINPEDIYHVTMMTCYDKKLESVRQQSLDNGDIPEVDCVLVTSEVEEVFDKFNIDLNNTALAATPDYPFVNIRDGKLLGMPGVSDGYADFVMMYAAKQIFHTDVNNIVYKTRRNDDFQYTNLEIDGEKVLSVAKVYGLRNIRNLVNSIKMNRCEYNFVEVMACPGGCTSGGGQLQKNRQDFGNIVEKLKERPMQLPTDNIPMQQALNEWYGTVSNPKKALQTTYKAIESKEVNPLHIEW